MYSFNCIFYSFKLKGNRRADLSDVERVMRTSAEYKDASDDEIETNAPLILEKLKKINKEYLQWFEVLMAMTFALIGYSTP